MDKVLNAAQEVVWLPQSAEALGLEQSTVVDLGKVGYLCVERFGGDLGVPWPELERWLLANSGLSSRQVTRRIADVLWPDESGGGSKFAVAAHIQRGSKYV